MINRTFIIAFSGVGVMGLLSGRLIQHNFFSEAAPMVPAQIKHSEEPSAHRDSQPTLEAGNLTLVRSTDSLQSLKELSPHDLHNRLFLWLLDANEDDISAFWQYYRTTDLQSDEIKKLIFESWANLNPQAAVDAVSGTGFESYAWAAWANLDPDSAYAAVMDQNPGELMTVIHSLCKYRAEWLIDHLDLIPEESRDLVIRNLRLPENVRDPLKLLNHITDAVEKFHQNAFNVLAARDPAAAYAWLESHRYLIQSKREFDTISTGFFKNLINDDPAAFLSLVDHAQPGDYKRKLEAVYFSQLLETNPELAKAKALASEAPHVAARMTAEVCLKLIDSDQEQAFAMMEKHLQKHPNSLTGATWIETESFGTKISLDDSPEINQAVDAFLARDPQRLMAMLPVPDSKDLFESSFSEVSYRWIEKDIDRYAEWADQLTDHATTDVAGRILMNAYVQRSTREFEKSANWSLKISPPESDPNRYVSQTLQMWGSQDPDEALKWVESQNFNLERAEALKKIIKPSKP